MYSLLGTTYALLRTPYKGNTMYAGQWHERTGRHDETERGNRPGQVAAHPRGAGRMGDRPARAGRRPGRQARRPAHLAVHAASAQGTPPGTDPRPDRGGRGRA